MAQRVLVFQHISFCPLGTMGDHLAAEGIEPTIVELNKGAKIPGLKKFDALIVLGGPQEVWQEDEHPWLVPEKKAIRRWVNELDRPLLGICLGHQLLADALGGEVGRSSRAETGLGEIRLAEAGRSHPLYAGFGSTKRAIQWHASEVKALPPGASLLASTADCPIASFAVGSAAFGIQYHAEATDTLVEEWSDLPAGGELAERLHGPGSITRIRREVKRAMPELRSSSRRLYDNFMEIARRRLAG